jgi:hypothetical protein
MATVLVLFFVGVEKMKLQSLKWCSENQQLTGVESPVDLRSTKGAMCRQQNRGYLEVWFQCLKQSKQYTHNCRTGHFPAHQAQKTYLMFGSVEDLSFEQWWSLKGQAYFGVSSTHLKIIAPAHCLARPVMTLTVQVSAGNLDLQCSQALIFWIEQIQQLTRSHGLLSQAPLAWPIFKSRITCCAMQSLLRVLEAHDRLLHHAPRTELWRIGEQLRLNPKAMTKRGDSASECVDKHIVMGKTVSAMVRKARVLVSNASNGVFPSFEKERN